MPISQVDLDREALTLTVTADYPVDRRRLWDSYLDPRQIEKFWGPPEFPAVFYRHDGYAGGLSSYVMTSERGDASAGYWRWRLVDAPVAFEVEDGFAHEDGTPNSALPTVRMRFEFTETSTGARLVTRSRFASVQALEELLDMGIEADMRSAMEQIDEIVTDEASFSAGQPVTAQELGTAQLRICRVLHGSPEDVWQAHHDAHLVRGWMHGGDEWKMVACQTARRVGESYRYEWERVTPSTGPTEGSVFGSTGVVLETEPPYREVASEAQIGHEQVRAHNELTLRSHSGGALLTLVITYSSAAHRAAALKQGMLAGMEESYARLEREVLPAM
ncbi:SRPBCC family protein [Leucobacter sp. HY1910]